MEKTENISLKASDVKKKKLTGTSYALLTTHGFNLVINIFVSTFLISFIYSISSNYVLNIGLFYVFNYLAFGIMGYFVSKLVDKTNRVSCYRVAIVINLLFILSVVFLGRELANIVWLAGLVHGFASAFYWCSYNVMKNELIPSSCMKKYATIQIIENKGIDFVIPIVLGLIIDQESFKTSAIIILVMAAIQMVASFFIKSHKPENSHFSMKEFVADTKKDDAHKEIFKVCFFVTLLYGCTNIIGASNTILVMLAFNSNLSLGLLTGVFSAVSILMLVLAKKFLKPGKTGFVYYLSAVILPIVGVLLAIFTQKWAVILFNFFWVAVNTLCAYYYDVYRNVILKKLKLYDDIAEFQYMIEGVLAIGRVAGFLLMVITGLIGSCFGVSGLIFAFKIYFALALLTFIAFAFLLNKFERVLFKHGIMW